MLMNTVHPPMPWDGITEVRDANLAGDPFLACTRLTPENALAVTTAMISRDDGARIPGKTLTIVVAASPDGGLVSTITDVASGHSFREVRVRA